MDPRLSQRPIPSLAETILVATEECTEFIGRLCEDAEDYNRSGVWLSFLCFFMHTTNRIGFSVLDHQRLVNLQRALLPLVLQKVYAAYLPDASADAKSNFGDDLLDCINQTELQYAECPYLIDEAKPLSGTGALSLLARWVTDEAGQQSNPGTMTAVICITTDVLTAAEFPEKIKATRLWVA